MSKKDLLIDAYNLKKQFKIIYCTHSETRICSEPDKSKCNNLLPNPQAYQVLLMHLQNLRNCNENFQYLTKLRISYESMLRPLIMSQSICVFYRPIHTNVD